jgi:hypothetical protein
LGSPSGVVSLVRRASHPTPLEKNAWARQRPADADYISNAPTVHFLVRLGVSMRGQKSRLYHVLRPVARVSGRASSLLNWKSAQARPLDAVEDLGADLSRYTGEEVSF